MFPAIKTALVDVCHRKKVNGVTILKSYGELGLGRSAQDPTRTNVLSQNSNSTEFCVPSTDPHTFGRPLPAGHSSMKGAVTVSGKTVKNSINPCSILVQKTRAGKQVHFRVDLLALEKIELNENLIVVRCKLIYG